MEQYPDIRGAEIICVDCETYDPDLKERGCGATRTGYIVGVAVGWRFPNEQQIHTSYYPVKHEGGGNLDRKQVWRYLRDMLSTPVPKTGANLQYDLNYLWSEGIQVEGPFYDIQVAEPLLEEERGTYSLESIAQGRLGVGKDEEAMLAYIRANFGAKPGKEKEYIWRCPAQVVDPYAKEDVRLPIEILDQQIKELAKEEMTELFHMESDLLPILSRMHLAGVRVDAAYAQDLSREWSHKITQLETQTQGINSRSSKQIASYLDSIGFQYPMTAKGNPSITAKWMETVADQVPLFTPMMELKKYKHFLGTFIDGYILDSAVNGRVHGQFNQLKGDEYGTVTGRLSASKPNLQNIPNPEKDPYFSSRCRGMFLPEAGQEWLRYDFSQIEYRLLVHFASMLPGGVADVARQMYNDNPDQDFHAFCAEVTGLAAKYGPKLGRKYAKNINFGLVYGMGKDKLQRSLGLSMAEAVSIFNTYHAKAPFAKAFSEEAGRRAANRGFIRTVGRRKRRFNNWESAKFMKKEDRVEGEIYQLKDRAAAVAKWGAVKRAGTHKAGNAVLQGSSADMTKKAMVDGYKAGIYDVLGFPLVTVHDEICFSADMNDRRHVEAAKEMKYIMENAYSLCVPVLVGSGKAKNWGEASVAPEIDWSKL